jgi:hypothetical protein
MRSPVLVLVSLLPLVADCKSHPGNGGTGGASSAGGSTGAMTNGAGGTTRSGSLGGSGGAGTTISSCATCRDPNWAEWPMPNGPKDVAAGAPHPESYTDNGDGTVTDDLTGLMWQQQVPATAYAWTPALAYCPSLTLGDHDDWRLPSLIELVSIVDAGVWSPSINSNTFPGTPWNSDAAWFWSSTPAASSTSSAWSVEFYYGCPKDGDVTNTFSVRCVRQGKADANAPAGRYTIAEGTVYDTKTMLTWQQTIPTRQYYWADAKTYCGSATVSSALGGSGWRLPTY